ncbi:RNA-binding protein 28 [Synchiropus splendidus]|uniref:RNA-binding protein 28 n=1 Tax=Synchiropus splendidus TaxID=270530 RepID=UPI00237E3925|nr:RNA-binding protein 28 [Synchiropus splendidus]
MAAQTIFVRSLPQGATNERLEEIFSEIGPVKQCFVVKEKGTDKCRGFGYVTYSMEDDAQRALKEIRDYDGRKLSLSVAKKKIRDKKKAAPTEPDGESKEIEPKSKGFRKKTLKSRLIIRNLSFKCSEDDLKNVFSKFGTVVEAKIPLKPDGKMRGFAFVMFKNVSEASQALKAMNLKEINGRQVAVDWAVPKDKYVATNPASSAGSTNKEEEASKPGDKDNDTEDEEVIVKKQESSQKTKAPSTASLKSVKEQKKEEPQSEEDEEEEEEEEDDDDDDDDEDEEDEDDPVIDEEEEDEELEGKKDADDTDEDEDDDDDDDDDDGDDEDEELELSPKTGPKKTVLPSDVKEGRTVFIRNLSFDTEEEGLEEVLLQFGEMNYIKIVLHPDTEHSKGCAFAQFKTKESADKCIAASQDEGQSGGIRVDGRKLFVVAAVTREDAVKLKVDKKKVESGTRNLFLAREGLIRAGTKAAEGVSEADMAKRARFEEVKRTKLRDQSIFVSKTRLCIHNLPKSVDQKKFRTLCLQPFKGNKRVRIVECRVMYDKKPQKGQVMGHSLGYGFVQFQEHEDALAALRYLNNNPDIFSEQKRPIVEFSLEDLRKLKIKEMRQQKNKEHLKRQLEKVGVKPQMSGGGRGFNKGGSSAQVTGQPTGKRKGVQQQQGDAKYSGFQTKPEVEYVELGDGKKRKKVLPLPSHHGPKNRMRDRGKQQAPAAKKSRPGQSRKDRQRRQMEKPTQPRNQVRVMKPTKRRGGDRFDSLVEQYKKKLMANSEGNSIRRSKWFDS